MALSNLPVISISPRPMSPRPVSSSRVRPVLSAALLAAGCLALAACASGKDRPKADLAAAQVTHIGVNSYLWRASLETLSFMPLTQADSSRVA